MSHIAAFVGHSFVETDQKVVQAILDGLNGIAEINPCFTWEHATHPEPSGVDQKVLRLFADKNLFIAICTKKEPVLVATDMKPIPLFGGYFIPSRATIQWKTSDWIIQEIGVAIGRNMRIVLLMEEGVKLPGSLQGNLEYITFRRETPHTCITALMGMIASMIPRALEGVAARIEKTENQEPLATAAEDAKTEETSADADWLTVNDSWDFTHFRIAYMIALRNQGAEASAQILRAFNESKFANDASIRSQWEAWKLLCKTRNGDTGALSDLKHFVDTSPNNAAIRETLARAYIDFGEHSLAAAEFARAADVATDARERLSLLRRQVEQLTLAKETKSIPEVVQRMRSITLRSQQAEDEVLLTELTLAKSDSRDDIVIGCLERLVELEPANAEHRFELAYKYSEVGENALAALHYSRIPAAARSGVAWNNLGAAFAALDLPCKAVEAYLKAEAQGETIATSNLANARMEAGFLKEASIALEAAIKGENPHKNVLTSLNRARALPEEEANKQKQLLDEAAIKSDFNRCYGSAIVRLFPGGIDGLWNGPKCRLNVQVIGDQFSATGTFEQRNDGILIRAMMGLRADSAAARPEPLMFDVKYVGKILGCSVSGEFSQTKQGERPKASSLLTGDAATKFYMWLDAAGGALHVMQQGGEADPVFYKLERIT